MPKSIYKILLQKRQDTLSFIFNKMRDPYQILKAYNAISPIVTKYCVNGRYKDYPWLEVMIFLNAMQTNATKKQILEGTSLTPTVLNTTLKKLIWRMNFVRYYQVKGVGGENYYHLSGQGKIHLAQFSREIVAAVMDVAKSKRKYKRKVRGKV